MLVGLDAHRSGIEHGLLAGPREPAVQDARQAEHYQNDTDDSHRAILLPGNGRTLS
jgi:hypothetical protein